MSKAFSLLPLLRGELGMSHRYLYRLLTLTTLVVLSAVLLTACAAPAAPAGGGSSSEAPAAESSSTAMTAIGEGEGAVSIVAWAGYIERGETDENYDWVTAFEADTGCKVEAKVAATSDE